MDLVDQKGSGRLGVVLGGSCVMSGWDKNDVTRKGRGRSEIVMLVLEQVLVIWSGLGGFEMVQGGS